MGSSVKVVSGVIWTTILNIVNAIYGFIAVPILINYFGKAQYGLIGLALSINVYMQLMDMGFNSTNVRFFSNWLSRNEYENVKLGFQTSLSFYGLIGMVNAIILVIISFFSSSIFNVTPEQDIILKNLFYILSISAFISWFSSCFDQLIRATENVAWIQIATLLTKILMIVVLAVTVFFKLNIETYYILTCLAGFSTLPWYVKKIKNILPVVIFKPKVDKVILKSMLPYCMNIFSFSIFQFSFYNLRPVLLGIEGSVESIADYRILNGITTLVGMVGGAFMGALIPSTSRIVAQNNQEAYNKVAYHGTRYISILVCFCCFGLMSVGPELITIYVGEQYLYLAPWLNLWLLCTLGTHNQAISTLILAGDDIRAISYSSVFASIVGLISAWCFIPEYQVGGTVIAFAIYIIIQLSFYYFYWWPKHMGINSWYVFSRCFSPYFIFGLVITVVILYIPHTGKIWNDLFLFGLGFAILYTILTILTLSESDKDFFRRLLHRQ